MEEYKLVKQGGISFVKSPELMSSAVCSSSPLMQHDTCPVCRKSLNGEDSSSQPPSESPSLSMDPRTQERWSFWDAHPSPPPFIRTSIRQTREESSFSRLAPGAVIIIRWVFFFLSSVFTPFSSAAHTQTQAVLRVTRGGGIFFFYIIKTAQSRPVIITSVSSFISASRKKK